MRTLFASGGARRCRALFPALAALLLLLALPGAAGAAAIPGVTIDKSGTAASADDGNDVLNGSTAYGQADPIGGASSGVIVPGGAAGMDASGNTVTVTGTVSGYSVVGGGSVANNTDVSGNKKISGIVFA